MRKRIILWCAGVVTLLLLPSLAKLCMYVSTDKFHEIINGKGRWIDMRLDGTRGRTVISGLIEKAELKFNDKWGFFDLRVVVTRDDGHGLSGASSVSLSPFRAPGG
jgi:hypothetical protein